MRATDARGSSTSITTSAQSGAPARTRAEGAVREHAPLRLCIHAHTQMQTLVHVWAMPVREQRTRRRPTQPAVQPELQRQGQGRGRGRAAMCQAHGR